MSTQLADETLGAAAAVADFHRAFNLPMRQSPSADVDKSLAKLRVALLQEEVGEFIAASEKGDLVAIADALADIAYVVYGTALTYGIDLDSVLREVHRSNMSKLGKPTRDRSFDEQVARLVPGGDGHFQTGKPESGQFSAYLSICGCGQARRGGRAWDLRR